MSLLLAAGSSGFTGTITATQDANTASLSGSVVASGVSGSITASQANNTAALTGAETFTGQITALQAGNTASLSGSVTSGAISGVITATQGDNTASLTGSGGQQVAGGYEDKPKKRFIVEKNGKLLVYSTAQAAIGSMDEPEPKAEPVKAEEKQEETTVRAQPEDVKPEVIDLSAVQEYAQVAGLIEQYNAAYRSAHYEALIALFEQMQDEDEIEMLLLGA